MPKWKSPLFSDIRNAIGDNVVFSMWKGRPFFRSYVIPANPKTDAQMAHRYTMTELVKRWQSLAGDADVVTAWNVSALPWLISGYNLFAKWGRLSEISVAPTSGSAPLDVTITYKCGVPLARAKCFQFDETDWTDVTPAGGMLAEGTIDITGLAAGTYTWFIADDETLKEGESSPQAYQAITKWKPDEVNGVAVECECVAS